MSKNNYGDSSFVEGVMPIDGEPSSKSETRKGKVVNCTAANVRIEPDKNSKVMVTLWAGTEVEILDGPNEFGYYKINAQHKTGYIQKDYCSEV